MCWNLWAGNKIFNQNGAKCCHWSISTWCCYLENVRASTKSDFHLFPSCKFPYHYSCDVKILSTRRLHYKIFEYFLFSIDKLVVWSIKSLNHLGRIFPECCFTSLSRYTTTSQIFQFSFYSENVTWLVWEINVKL